MIGPQTSAPRPSNLSRSGFRSRGEHGIPGRSYFDCYDAEEKVSYVHIHAYPEGHSQAVAHKQFNAALVRDAACVERYNEIKRDLLKSGIERADYPGAKTDFIMGVLAQAQHDITVERPGD